MQRWSCSVSSRDGAKAARRKESQREEEVVWERTAKWRLRRKQTARKSWMPERSTYRDIEQLTDMEPVLRDRCKESWKEELQEIERKRTELLLEY